MMVDRSRGRLLRWLGPLMAVIALAGILLADRLHNSQQVSVCSKLQFPDDSPIHGGRSVDLATAMGEMPFTIPIPHAAQANGENLVQIWSEPEAREVGLVFGNGGQQVVLDVYPTALRQPEAAFQQGIDLNVSEAAIVQIDGEPALLTEPRTDQCGTNPASLRSVHEGVEVILLSSDLTTSDLVAIAQSLSFAQSP
jgi:hypothetical protein